MVAWVRFGTVEFMGTVLKVNRKTIDVRFAYGIVERVPKRDVRTI